LLDLLGRKSEGGEEFYDYLHQDICQNWRRRDPDINAKSAEEVLEGRKQIEECVITGTDVFDRLRDLDVTEICRWDRRRGHTASRTAMPAKIAFAGGNGCRKVIRKKELR
jgi:hypothetical protein